MSLNNIHRNVLSTVILFFLFSTAQVSATPWYGEFSFSIENSGTVFIDNTVTGDELVFVQSDVPAWGDNWVNTSMTVFGPGNYSLSSNFGAVYDFNVGAEQLLARMEFEYFSFTGIDAYFLWNVSIGECAYGSIAGSGLCTNYTAVDPEGDGLLGTDRINPDPFSDASYIFQMSAPIPTPATLLLIVPGLLFLVKLRGRVN